MHLASEQDSLLETPLVEITPQPVKTFDRGIVDIDGYGAFSGFAPEKANIEDLDIRENVSGERHKRVIIIGAGVCGIQQASVLLRDGFVDLQDIHIFDALEGYGGVWQKNKYPGCACDVPAMIYTTSYHINKSKYLNPQSYQQLGFANTERLDSFLRPTISNRRILYSIRIFLQAPIMHSIQLIYKNMHMG